MFRIKILLLIPTPWNLPAIRDSLSLRRREGMLKIERNQTKMLQHPDYYEYCSMFYNINIHKIYSIPN